ncbi:MAG: hypothetical protein N2C12_07550, partial [Planctomycetales bacterium]
EAYKLYEQMIAQTPDDIVVRRELAESLTRCDTPECHRRALVHWRFLESRAKQGSLSWLRSRAEIIRSLLGTGQQPEASKLLRVTQLLYPDPGDESLQQLFSELKQKIDRRK